MPSNDENYTYLCPYSKSECKTSETLSIILPQMLKLLPGFPNKQQGRLTLDINSDKSQLNKVASESHNVRSPFTPLFPIYINDPNDSPAVHRRCCHREPCGREQKRSS